VENLDCNVVVGGVMGHAHSDGIGGIHELHGAVFSNKAVEM
jgi:hypothetical protein